MDGSTSITPTSGSAIGTFVRECIAILLWTFILVKLFVFDVDSWILNEFSPGLDRVLRYKALAFTACLLIAWRLLGRKQFPRTALYVLGYPFVFLF